MKALSGGERNRLLLARLFTRPANVLVLDEPTNDLDLETLELLEAQLTEWPGTLLLVSHDRAFLDNVVTSTLRVRRRRRVQEYVGGYEDWQRQRAAVRVETPAAKVDPPKPARSAGQTGEVPASRKLSYMEQRELVALPDRIEGLEQERAALEREIMHPDFYKEPPGTIEGRLARQRALEAELDAAYRRWDELDSQPR